MSSHILHKTFQNFPEGGIKLAIMLGIAEAANDQGNCILTQQALADAARINRVSIWRHVKDLVTARWIVIDAKGGRHGATIYQINLPMIFRAQRPGVKGSIRMTTEIPAEAFLRRIGLMPIPPTEQAGEIDAA